MSNLSLPTMTYAALSERLGSKWRVPLAYATYAERVSDDTIFVKHHTSVIAVLSPDQVQVTNAGYTSSTTANRLRIIMRDNQIPFRVRIKDFTMRLVRIADWQGPLAKQIDEGVFTQATFIALPGTSIMYKAV